MTATSALKESSGEENTTRRCRKNPFYSIKFFLFCHGLLQLAQLLVSGYLKSTISTIEKRYGLSSQTSGMLTSFNEVGNTVLIVFVSFFGSRVHRPRFIGIGALIASLAGFLMASAHLITSPYEYDHSIANHQDNNTDICQLSPLTSQFSMKPSEGNAHEHKSILALMFIGQLLLGIGGVPIQPFGISYIDDYASERNSPLYIGLLFAITTTGPALAFMLGSAMLRFYVDIDKVSRDSIDITTSDPRWVGAWWLGFLVSASFLAVTCIPYFFFPREMPKEGNELRTSENKTKKGLMKDGKTKADLLKDLTLLEFIKSFPRILLRTLRSPIFLLVVLAEVNLSAMVAGLATFMAKFLERQFTVTASFANLLIGGVNIPIAVVGIVTGGAIMKRLHLSLKRAALMSTVSLFICVLLATPLLFIGCSTQKVAGLNTEYSNGYLDNNTPECISSCSCRTEAFNPVCGSDGVEYSSPCHAGCRNVTLETMEKTKEPKVLTYTDCSCISADPSNATAAPGQCGSSCSHLLLPFMVLSALAGFVASFSHTPSFIMVLRSVPPEDKSLALGIQFMILRVLAWMPGPVLFGSAIDTACISWETKYNKTASCRYYDNDLFRQRYLGLQLLFECGAFFCFLMVFIILSKLETEREGKKNPEMCKVTEQLVLDKSSNSSV